MAKADGPLAARLNYAQCWEDTRMLLQGLRPAGGQRVLSIASAGDNSIALALAGAEVVAVDLSVPQLALCELKLAARHLDWPDYRALFGLGDPRVRLPLYARVRSVLSQPARGWWDARPELLAGGLVEAGRFEGYLRTFRQRLLPLVHRRSTVQGWFDLDGIQAQADYYHRRWDNLRWRALFRLFFSQRVMAARGRSPEQFAHVQGAVSQAFLQRAERMFCTVPLRDNGYVQWMLLGRWVSPEAEPAWLSEAAHARLGEVSERLRLVHVPLQQHLLQVGEGTYHGFNLSDLFEYLDQATTEALLAACARAGRPGARLAYWNLLVPRQRPESLAQRLRPLRQEAQQLHAGDRAFVYGAFRLEEVL